MEASRDGATVTHCRQEESETEQIPITEEEEGFIPALGRSCASLACDTVVLRVRFSAGLPWGCAVQQWPRICLGALFCLQASSSTRWRSRRWWPALRQQWAAGG